MSPNWAFFTGRIGYFSQAALWDWGCLRKQISLALLKWKCFILNLTLKLFQSKLTFRTATTTRNRCDSWKALFWKKWHGLVMEKQIFSSAKLNAPQRSGVRLERCSYGCILCAQPGSHSGWCHPVIYTLQHSLEASCVSQGFPAGTDYENVSLIKSKSWKPKCARQRFFCEALDIGVRGTLGTSWSG